MARINIEQSLHKDARFDELKIKMGSRFAAMGALVYAWSVAQEYFLVNGGKIPIKEWEKQKLPNEIIDVGLATQCSEFVTMSGVDKQFAWLKQKSEAGRKNIEEFNNRRRSGVNVRTSSSSSSFSKERNTYAQQAALVYEKFYPRKIGRGEGLKRLKLTSEQDLADFEIAVRRYAGYVRGKDPKFTKHFSTFVSNWRDWLPSTTTPTPEAAAPSLDEMLHVPPIGDEA